MKNIILKYGIISGSIVILVMIIGFIFADTDSVALTQWFGYLIMIVALSMIFIGIKEYKKKQSGQINFATAFKVGLGISVVAAIMYVIGWEIYFSINDEQFISDYMQKTNDSQIEAGVSGDELEKYKQEMAQSFEAYRSFPYRIGITFLEIFPVALLITIVSAFILKNKKPKN